MPVAFGDIRAMEPDLQKPVPNNEDATPGHRGAQVFTARSPSSCGHTMRIRRCVDVHNRTGSRRTRRHVNRPTIGRAWERRAMVAAEAPIDDTRREVCNARQRSNGAYATLLLATDRGWLTAWHPAREALQSGAA